MRWPPRLLATAALAMLACKPTHHDSDLGAVGDPAPPMAPVLATLTDAGAFAPDARAGADAPIAGSVLTVQPRDHGGVTEPIIVTFTTPMDSAASTLEFALDPHVPGSLRWTSPTRAVFAPETTLSEGRRYAVHVSGVAQTREGQRVEVQRRWAFETPRPSVSVDGDYALYDDDRVQWTAGFNVYTSSDVTKKALRNAITVEQVHGSGNHPLPFRVEAMRSMDEPRRDAWRILPRGHWPADAKVRATVDGSLVTLVGPLPTGRDVFDTIHTRRGVTAAVSCDDQAKDGCVMGRFELEFDAPVPLWAATRIHVSPRPKNFSAELYRQPEDKTFNHVWFGGDFEIGRTYTVKLDKGIRDASGQQLIGARSFEVRAVAPPPLLDFVGEGTQLSLHKGAVGVESRSLQDAVLTVSTLSDAALAEVIAAAPSERALPSHGVSTRELALDLTPGGMWGWDAHRLDLSAQLGKAAGAAFFELSAGAVVPGQQGRAELERSHGLVQLTDLGVLVGASPSGSFVRVVSLESAAPLAEATAHLYDTSASPPKELGSFGPSDAGGFIRIPGAVKLRGHTMVVERDDDRIAMALHGHDGHGWRSRHFPARGSTFDVGVVMTDRDLFQPGERMRVMGWTARSSNKHAAGLESSGTRPVHVELVSHDDRVLAESTVRTKAYGKFWATLDIPQSAGLGYASVRAHVGREKEHTFRRTIDIRQFVPPAYDVSLALEDAEIHHGQVTRGLAAARYLHGMPTPLDSASTRTFCQPHEYRPVAPGSFWVAQPTTPASGRSSGWIDVEAEPEHRHGRLTFDVDFGSLGPAHAYHCSLELLTMDAARQEIATTVSSWVHPSHYLLVERDDATLRIGRAHTFRARAVLPSGATTTSNPAKLVITAHEDPEHPTVVHSCPMPFDDEGNARCTWTPRKTGRYTAEVSGTVDRSHVTHRTSLWVEGKRRKKPAEHRFAVQMPNVAEVGTAVEVSVQTEHPTASGLAVLVHAGIRATHPFDVVDHAGVVSLAPDDTWVPRAYVDTFATHPAAANALPDLEHASGEIDVGYTSRQLTVALDNPATASVGATLPIDIAVTGPTGDPVSGAHVSVWAVDESILMLRDWTFPDFAAALTVDRGNEARYAHNYDSLRFPYRLRNDPYGPGGRGAGFAGRGKRVPRVRQAEATAKGGSAGKTRTNFDPAPIFVGDVTTDPDGMARVYGTLPDNLTTFRIAAVATAEVPGTGAFARAGRSESQVRVTQDLSVRPVLPRVLRPGDTAQVGVLIDNLSGKPGRLGVELRLHDADGRARIVSKRTFTQRLDEPQTRIPVTVEASAPGEVRVWVRATLTTDEGQTFQDASEVPFEIRTERTLVRHAATHGSIVDAPTGAIELQVPPQHVPGSAQATVDVFASMLGGYKGTVGDLVEYPYGCVEQTSSRLVPLVALHGLHEFDLGVGDVSKHVAAGIERLESMQTADGGFSYWPGSSTAHPYATAYAVWVLSELQRSGFAVPGRLVASAGTYLRAQLSDLREMETPTAREDTRAAMAALALASVGEHDDATLDALLSRTHTLPAFSRALLAMAVHERDPGHEALPGLLDELRDRVEVRGEVATTRAESVRYANYFDSPVRTDAMVLLALIRTAPTDPLVELLARGLTAARDERRLRNTQENAFALLAMSGYAALRESAPADLDVKAWIGPNMVIDSAFEGRDLSVQHGEAGLAGSTPRVTLQRTGIGRMYYRVGMDWAPNPLTIEAHARGLAIERRLYDARGLVTEERSMVAGESGTLEVTITADARQRYVAIDIPLPAGIESVDRSLGRGGASKDVVGSGRGPWLYPSHQELRDDRVLVFVDHLRAGTYSYRVPIRTTHEGQYTMPPATAHAMYSPEVAGNSDGQRIRIVSP